MRGFLTIALVAMMMSVLAFTSSHADAEGGTVVLAPGEHLSVVVPNNGSVPMWARYYVRVIEGPPVNVWVVDQEGYLGYLDDNASQFPYFHDNSEAETHLAEVRFSIGWNGSACIVIDNRRNAGHGQEVRLEYYVYYGEEHPIHIPDSPSFFMVLGVMVLIYFVLIIIVLVPAMRRIIDERESEDGWMSSSEGDGATWYLSSQDE